MCLWPRTRWGSKTLRVFSIGRKAGGMTHWKLMYVQAWSVRRVKFKIRRLHCGTSLANLYYIIDISLKATVYWFFSKIVKFCSCRLCFILTCFNSIFTEALGGAFTCVTSTFHYSLAYALERPTTQVSVLEITKKKKLFFYLLSKALQDCFRVEYYHYILRYFSFSY